MYYLKFQQECQEIFLNTHKKIPDRMGLPRIFRTLLISWRISCFRGIRTGPSCSPPIV